jgi:hypothetical protein
MRKIAVLVVALGLAACASESESSGPTPPERVGHARQAVCEDPTPFQVDCDPDCSGSWGWHMMQADALVRECNSTCGEACEVCQLRQEELEYYMNQFGENCMQME